MTGQLVFRSPQERFGAGHPSESLIGELPHRWNHLVNYDAPDPDAGLVHFTLGGPYFNEYRDCEFADQWRAELADMLNVQQRVPAAKTG